MTSKVRGAAMIETAIVLSMVLVIILGAMQLAMAGYYQATSEGAAFIGAHAASINSNGQAADQTYGYSVAQKGFPGLPASKFTLTNPQTNFIQVIVDQNAGGLMLVPGANKNIRTVAGDIEPILANILPNTGSTNSGFAVQASLVNYCVFQNANRTNCSSRTIYLAQFDNIDGNGNGKNGQFAEWNCRPTYFEPYGGGYFPTVYPATAGVWKSIYDPGSTNFGNGYQEANLYSFDTSNKWGTQSSC